MEAKNLWKVQIILFSVQWTIKNVRNIKSNFFSAPEMLHEQADILRKYAENFYTRKKSGKKKFLGNFFRWIVKLFCSCDTFRKAKMSKLCIMWVNKIRHKNVNSHHRNMRTEKVQKFIDSHFSHFLIILE